jgi:neurotransmitter:Na+ symporter, NSS family
MTRESWASRFGFIMATAGFAIGLGNIWRFPYLTGMNGGGAFLIVYLAIALLIGIPLFAAEMSLGRKAQLSPIAGMRKLTGRAGSPWNVVGWLGVTVAFLASTYYFVLIGWVLIYVLRTAVGGFQNLPAEQIASTFGEIVANPALTIPALAFAIALTGLVVTRGLQQGVERANKVLMPALFVTLVLLAIGSLMLPGAMEGLRWYLWPDFTRLTPASVLAALGQVFFSIGVGMAGGWVYGSYLKPESSDVPGGAATVVAFDAFVAFTAGLVMFPAVFAFGLAPDSGPGLLFLTMSNVFARAPFGAIVGAVFFFLIFIAAITSAIGLVEAVASSLMDSLNLSRAKAVWGLLAVLFVLGVPIALSQGPWADVTVLGRNLFDLFDFVSGNVLLPLSGLMIALYVGWSWGFERFQEETNVGARVVRVAGYWKPLVKLLIPAAIVIVLLRSLGLF